MRMSRPPRAGIFDGETRAERDDRCASPAGVTVSRCGFRRRLAEQTDLREGSEVELSVTDGALTVRPRAPGYRLEQLLDQITPENRHDEIDWGEPQGKEVW